VAVPEIGPAPTDRWAGRLRVAATTTLLAGIAYTIVFVYFAFRARFTVPYFDDWSWLASLQDGGLASLWQPHNEHLIVIPRLLVWIDFWIWGWPGYASLLAALLAHASVAAVFIWMCRGRDVAEARLLAGAVLIITFSTYGLQGAVFPAAVNFPLVVAFATLAVASLAHGAAAASRRHHWMTAAGVCSVLAMLCVSNGLAVPFILVALALLLRLPRAALAFLALGLAGAAVRYAIGGVPESALVASLPAVMRFTLATLAGPAASLSIDLALGVGALFLVLAAVVCWRFVRTRARPPADAIVAGCVAFAIAGGFLTAIGRAQFDPSVAAQSRYTELAALGWASLLLALPAGLTDRRVGRMAAMVLAAVAIIGFPAQLFVGRVWAAKADHLAVAGLALATGVDDDDWISRIHPLGSSLIDPVLPLLRDRGVGFLSFPEAGQRVTASTAPPCDGRVEAFNSLDSSPILRIRGQLRNQGAALRLLDGESRAQGLALPAPTTEHPLAYANDFVWAELEILSGRVDIEGLWVGVSKRGSGPPFQAELIDDKRSVICTATVDCCASVPEKTTRREIVVRGNQAQGFLDGADCTAVRGWLWDPVRPDIPLDVRIAVDNGVDVVERASLFRQDLRDAGKGNGAHGFHVPSASLKLGPGTWHVNVRVAATGVPLVGSPRTVTCDR
jgi:hypothetical protein